VKLDNPSSKVSYRGVAAKKSDSHYLVAVVDRKKRTAKILPAESGLEVIFTSQVKG
jgi:hypothetical protein